MVVLHAQAMNICVIKLTTMHIYSLLLQLISLLCNQVNTMALNTDYALRTGAFEPETGTTQGGTLLELKKIAQERYDKVKVCNNVMLFIGH